MSMLFRSVACAGPACVQRALYMVARPDYQFVHVYTFFVIFSDLRFSHILVAVICI